MLFSGRRVLNVRRQVRPGTHSPFQLVNRWPSPGPTPHMHHADDFGAVVDREEDTVHVRLSAVAENPNRIVRIDALGCNRRPIWMLVQCENRALEAVEPSRTLLRCALDHPEVQFLELGFRVLRKLNAVCHACAAGE